MFLDYNACPHRARAVTQFLENHGIQPMDSPSKFIDLNSTENVCDMITENTGELEATPQGLQQLRVALEAAWDALDVRDTKALRDSTRTRCKTVTTAG